MALYYYRQHYLEQDYKNDLGSQIMQFLVIKRVYPDVADGVKQSGTWSGRNWSTNCPIVNIGRYSCPKAHRITNNRWRMEEPFAGEMSNEELSSEWNQFKKKKKEGSHQKVCLHIHMRTHIREELGSQNIV